MLGNLTSALGSSGTALRQPPAMGTANAPANPAGNFMGLPNQQMGGVANPQRQQGNGMMTGTQGMPQPGIGNLPAPAAPPPPPQPQSGFQQVMSQLHPQATAALKAIPQATMAHLTQAGLMHPGVMQHLYGNGNNNGMAS
jgi:hypothetical protein